MFKSLLTALRARHTPATLEETPPISPLDRLRELREMMWDSTRLFSLSETSAELDEIAKQLNANGNRDPETRGELAYASGYIHARRGEDTQAIAAYRRALAAHEVTPFLPHKPWLSARLGIGISHENLGQWAEAVRAYTDVLPDIAASADYSDDEHGGVMEKRAYCLHELGRYDEALEQNLALIEFARGFLPDTSPNLCSVLTNTAQNLHALDRATEAEAYLTRCLDIAKAHDDHDRAVEMHFQLGVPAFETGDMESARAHMTAGRDHALEHGDDWLKERSAAHLDELEERLSAQL